jgi:putative tricarboxylic transport membrane protein
MNRLIKDRLLRSDTVAALVVIATSAGLLVPTAQLRRASAMLPASMLVSLIVLAVILLVVDQYRAAAGEPDRQLTKAPKRAFSVFILVALYFVSVEFLGFYLSTTLSVPIVAYVFGYRDRFGLIIATVIVVAAIYLIFDVAMNQQFPAGRLWAMWQHHVH